MNLEPGKYRFRSHDYEGKWMQASIVDEVTKGIPIKDLDFELSFVGDDGVGQLDDHPALRPMERLVFGTGKRKLNWFSL